MDEVICRYDVTRWPGSVTKEDGQIKDPFKPKTHVAGYEGNQTV